MKSIRIPRELQSLNELFTANGFEAYLVGGAVRDMLLGKSASDWDITTDAKPKDIMRMFKKVIPTGIAHGTVTIHFMGKEIEATTFRCDGGYSDGRHPDSVSFSATLEQDLSRRDFTMNAVAASLSDGTIADPFGGRKDIRRALIRTVGDARERFLEDGLRPIRALRFCSQLHFAIDADTLSAISLPEVREKIRSISAERFRDEFTKILLSPVPSVGLRLLEQTGILAMFIPELAECRGCSQADARGFHEFDVLDHTVYACDGADSGNLVVRLAALFHDIGKKDARTTERAEYPAGSGTYTELVHFHRHEVFSAQKTEQILFRLKFPNAVTEKVVHLIQNHMFFFEEQWTDAAVRRFIVRVGRENIDDLFALRLADIYGMHRKKAEPSGEAARNMLALRERIRRIESEKNALSLRDLAVNGTDLLNIGVPAGKTVGLVLNELFQRVLDDPDMNDRETLLRTAEQLAKQNKSGEHCLTR